MRLPFPVSRVLIVSDFNCPYCFTLNEWIASLGLSSRCRWLGIEHRPSLSNGNDNTVEEYEILNREIEDIITRAPEVRARHPGRWSNSRDALLIQNAVEDDYPEHAADLRQHIFRSYWWEGTPLSPTDSVRAWFSATGLPVPEVDSEYLEELTEWWRDELDRIPCMISPTGVVHRGLQDMNAVISFLNSSLHEGTDGPGCGRVT